MNTKKIHGIMCYPAYNEYGCVCWHPCPLYKGYSFVAVSHWETLGFYVSSNDNGYYICGLVNYELNNERYLQKNYNNVDTFAAWQRYMVNNIIEEFSIMQRREMVTRLKKARLTETA